MAAKEPCLFVVPEEYVRIGSNKIISGPSDALIQASADMSRDKKHDYHHFKLIFISDYSQEGHPRQVRVTDLDGLYWKNHLFVISVHWLSKNRAHLICEEAYPATMAIITNYNYKVGKGDIDLYMKR